MPIAINGSGTVTGISVGGLPDGIVDTDMLAANAVTEAKLATDQQQGLAKAWVNFNGTGTLAIRDSFNVSSVTDEGTGDYTVNFAANALANANYCITGSISWSNGSRNILSVASETGGNSVAPTTTALRLESVNYGNGNQYDADYISIAVFGD